MLEPAVASIWAEALLTICFGDARQLDRLGDEQLGAYVAELVSHAGPHGTESDGRELGEVDRNDTCERARTSVWCRGREVLGGRTPSALNAKLDEEGAGCEAAERIGQEPERNESTGPDAHDDPAGSETVS